MPERPRVHGPGPLGDDDLLVVKVTSEPGVWVVGNRRRVEQFYGGWHGAVHAFHKRARYTYTDHHTYEVETLVEAESFIRARWRGRKS